MSCFLSIEDEILINNIQPFFSEDLIYRVRNWLDNARDIFEDLHEIYFLIKAIEVHEESFLEWIMKYDEEENDD